MSVDRWFRWIVNAVGILLLMPLFSVFASHYFGMGLNAPALNFSDEAKLSMRNAPYYQAVLSVDKLMKLDECVLVFRQADYAYYGSGCYLSYLDSRQLPFYLNGDPSSIREELLARKVRYVLIPGYGMAEIHNSSFQELLQDPALMELVADFQFSRVFRLRNVDSAHPERPTVSVEFGTDDFSVAGKKETKRIELTDWRAILLGSRSLSVSGAGRLLDALAAREKPGDGVYVAELEAIIRGEGYVSLVWERKVNKGAKRAIYPLWDGRLNSGRTVNIRFLLTPDTLERFQLMLGGSGWVELDSMRISLTPHESPLEIEQIRRQALRMGWTSFSSLGHRQWWDWGAPSDSGNGAFLKTRNDRLYVLASPIKEIDGDILALSFSADGGTSSCAMLEWLESKVSDFNLWDLVRRQWIVLTNDPLLYDVVFKKQTDYLPSFLVAGRSDCITPGIGQGHIDYGRIPEQADAYRLLFLVEPDESHPAKEIRNLQVNDLNLPGRRL